MYSYSYQLYIANYDWILKKAMSYNMYTCSNLSTGLLIDGCMYIVMYVRMFV